MKSNCDPISANTIIFSENYVFIKSICCLYLFQLLFADKKKILLQFKRDQKINNIDNSHSKNMFKKRNKQTNINLSLEVQHIPDTFNELQSNPIHNQHRQAHLRSDQKALEDYQAQNNLISVINAIDQSQKQSRNQENKQLEQCFEQFKKYQQQEKIKEKEAQVANVIPIYCDVDQVEQNNGYVAEVKVSKVRMEQAVMEDQDAVQLLEYDQDYGQLSNQEISGQYEDGYENQLIKRSVNREVYLQLSKGLKKAHIESQQQKILHKIKKISVSLVRRKIAKEIQTKSLRRAELRNQLRQMHEKASTRQQIKQQKIEQVKQLEGQYEKIKKIMNFVYYHGDQVEQFSQQKILRQLQNPFYFQKINKIKNYRAKKIKKMQEKKKNKMQKRQQKKNMHYIDVEDQIQELYNSKKRDKKDNHKKQEMEQEQEQDFGFGKKRSNKMREEQYSDSEQDDDNYMIIDD